MINAVHFLLYSKEPDADRAFLSDVLGFSSVDAGRGWLIFALPPAEIAVHPTEEDSPANASDGVVGASVYLMCDDLESTMKSLQARNAKFGPIDEARWGTVTTLDLPSGAKVGLYQPKHPVAAELR